GYRNPRKSPPRRTRKKNREVTDLLRNDRRVRAAKARKALPRRTQKKNTADTESSSKETVTSVFFRVLRGRVLICAQEPEGVRDHDHRGPGVGHHRHPQRRDARDRQRDEGGFHHHRNRQV